MKRHSILYSTVFPYSILENYGVIIKGIKELKRVLQLKNREVMIKIKKIKPMFTSLVTTMDIYTEEECSIAEAYKKGTIKEVQKVLSVGPSIMHIKEGDLVSINPIRYAVRKHDENSIRSDIEGGNPVLKYEFNVIELDDKPCLLLQDRDINYVIEDYEEIETPKKTGQTIIMPCTTIIS